MKYLLNDLNETTSIDVYYDYSNHINKINDILSIQPAHVTGALSHSHNQIVASITVDVKMDIACSKTLKPVPYTMRFDAEIIFGTSIEADYRIENPLDLTEIIFGYIISEKPYTIYHPDANKDSFEKEKSQNPAFADLDKLLKK